MQSPPTGPSTYPLLFQAVSVWRKILSQYKIDYINPFLLKTKTKIIIKAPMALHGLTIFYLSSLLSFQGPPHWMHPATLLPSVPRTGYASSLNHPSGPRDSFVDYPEQIKFLNFYNYSNCNINNLTFIYLIIHSMFVILPKQKLNADRNLVCLFLHDYHKHLAQDMTHGFSLLIICWMNEWKNYLATLK